MPTTAVANGAFAPGPTRVVLDVRSAAGRVAMTVTVDGRVILEWDGEALRLSTNTYSAGELRGARTLALATWATKSESRTGSIGRSEKPRQENWQERSQVSMGLRVSATLASEGMHSLSECAT